MLVLDTCPNDGCKWWRLENVPSERLQLAWTTGSPVGGKVAGGDVTFLLRHLLNI